MEGTKYIINPVVMGGKINTVLDDQVKLNLRGRLGVLYISKELIMPGVDLSEENKLEFYFSYLWIVENKFDYDLKGFLSGEELSPVLMGGVIDEVNDTAAKIIIDNNFGTIAVPRRWLFTEVEPEVGQNVEFYFSKLYQA